MKEPQRFKDHHRETRLFMRRLGLMAALIVLLTGALAARYYNLQVVHHEIYATQSDRNRVHVQPVPPTRGLIHDASGELLADNRPSYTLSLVRERVPDLEETIELLRDLVRITDVDLERFYRQMRQRRRPFEAIPLRYRLAEDEIARLAVNEYRLDGVEVDAQLVRHYPYNELFAHVLGYTGRISEAEVLGFDEEDFRRYAGTHSIGKNGLERHYEGVLLGEVGNQNVETNARGRVLRVLGRVAPSPGRDIQLHLDAHLQQVAHDGLGDHRGALVALDVNSGAVLAAVSTPSFDPNLFVTGISFNDYRTLSESLDVPLFNRFLQGQYPAGSTLKPMIGLAGLHYGIVDIQHTINDPGYYQLSGSQRLYRCWRREGHGPGVDLMRAIIESCNTYFFDLGHRMGIDLMHEFGTNFGLGELSGIDIPGERRGLWPSRDWKRQALGMSWFPGDTLNVSIGQGDVLVTPLQLAVMTATLANGGQRLRPQLVKVIDGEPVAPVVEDSIDVDQGQWQYMMDAMTQVAHGERGTARASARGLTKYRMAGKTGTVQLVGIAQGERYDSELLLERHREHALYVGFAPVDNPQVAVGIIVENAESGASAAAPVARALFDAYLLDRDTSLAEAPGP